MNQQIVNTALKATFDAGIDIGDLMNVDRAKELYTDELIEDKDYPLAPGVDDEPEGTFMERFLNGNDRALFDDVLGDALFGAPLKLDHIQAIMACIAGDQERMTTYNSRERQLDSYRNLQEGYQKLGRAVWECIEDYRKEWAVNNLRAGRKVYAPPSINIIAARIIISCAFGLAFAFIIVGAWT